MLSAHQLKGIFIPIITPFLPSGELDLASFERMVSQLLTHDIHGIVLNGTTGESPTVAWEEVRTLMESMGANMRRGFGQESVRGTSQRSVPIIIGVGTNDTRASVRRAEMAGNMGADAVLVVTPYYSRPSQEGIVAHYERIAQVGVPVIAYEIPARTGVRVDVDTMRRILDIDGVIGLKDSSGGTDLVSALTASGNNKPILCGEDRLFHAMLGQGASGGMLASAHVETDAFLDVYRLAAEGRYSESLSAFNCLLPLIELLFRESNPAPLKWLLAQQGVLASDTLRLPMMPITAGLQTDLGQLLAKGK
ncbi:4-hydroxy-tetrahydrodipicolinate synthase [Paenibacillus cellulosilyticus]|uniref:4-hydroxy-tetrahydrodipicolinate synthase n=1 Tax=Paenibacillus cellulosilyticus TaxID=375489 RepID=A0A2V2YQG2_9BACL|nr:4-hydroxy-tetrahydrodipicolinate synthase [Paenibacillus cellulosilyticus]PWV97948.1 4-hydroxy-tetrahydrodipicolinate synthase [Paenibacillus cellulosilyticus]QKS44018.1 4-hydroxy-tetrahydrodipicolinate synthase [Paenibacillus cellulosilyticus]